MRWMWRLVWTGVLAFFLAGAVVFPLVEPYYFARVALSLGVWGVLNGIDSVLHFGLVHTSGLLSGGERVHSVRPYGFVLWIGLFVHGIWRERRRAQARWEQWADAQAQAEAKALQDEDDAQGR